MSLSTRKLFPLATLALVVFCLLPSLAAAQQVTFYSFDPAVNNNGFTCTDPAHNPAANNFLLCFNDINGTNGQGAYPLIQSGVIYPQSLGGGTHADMLMNPSAGGHSETAWFSVPQKIANGFSSYFAFRLTLGQTSYATADGVAFVVQNAQGGGKADADSGCQERAGSSGPTMVTGGGGCIGYSGIDNSLAVEFDTYTNVYDPGGSDNGGGLNDTDSNHIAVQSCGTTRVNSSSHYGPNPCLLVDDNSQSSAGSINPAPGVTLADGTVHQAVVEYSGAQGTPANLLQVFIDPPFVTGTHTPCTVGATGCSSAASPVISVTYNLASHLNLLNTDSAYVGFTAADGAAFEEQEILSWTFTPHTVATQQQPLQPAGKQTTFPFGNHTYAVTYETGNTSNIEMVVSAITISPSAFEALLAGTSFTGSECQVYDGTGGNCIVYSASCFQLPLGNPPTPVACPPTNDPNTDFIDLKTAFENSIQPTSPGLIQGDPLLSPIASISGDGHTATVTCTGECATTVGQSVRILSNHDSSFNVSATVLTTPEVNSFTFASGDTNTGQAGGYVTSNNLQNIFLSYNPQRIDGTVTGHTKSFSEFVATSVTAQATAFTSPASATFTAGQFGTFTVTASGIPTPSLAQGGVALPSGLTFLDNHDGTGTLSGTPAAGTASPYAITFTAHNTAGPDAVQLFTLTVLPPVLESIAVTPNPASVAVGLTQPFVATGTYGDHSTQVLTGSVIWNSSNTAAATIAATGVATGVAPGSTNITAKLSGVTSPPAVLTVTSQLSVLPGSLPFGVVDLGSRTDLNLAVKNVGTTSLKITNIYFHYGPGSGKDYGYFTQCGGTLKAGQSCSIRVELFAQDLGAGSAVLGIAYNLPGSPALVNLSGTVINPRASLNEDELNFGTERQNTSSTKTIILTSTGSAPLLISSVIVSGSKDFTTSSCPASLAVHTSCTITVTFKPSAKQSRSGTLIITDNALSSPQTVSLSGKGN